MSIRFLKLSLASPESIRSWTERVLPNGKRVGKILKGDLIDYKNGLPIRDGLSCERIFGPMVSFTCTCGRFKCIETRGIHIVHDTLRSSRPVLPDVSRQTGREKQFDKLESPFQSPANLTKIETSIGTDPIVSQNTISKPNQKLVSNEKPIGFPPSNRIPFDDNQQERDRVYENLSTSVSKVPSKKLKLNEPYKSAILQPIAYNKKKIIRFLSDFYYDYESIYHFNKNEIVPSFVSIMEEPYYTMLTTKNLLKPQKVCYPLKKRQIIKAHRVVDFLSFIETISDKNASLIKLRKTHLKFKTGTPRGTSFSRVQNLLKPLYKFVFQIYTEFWFDLKMHYNNLVYEKHIFLWTSQPKFNSSKSYNDFGEHLSFFSKFKIQSLYDKSQKLPIISGILPRPTDFFNFPSLPQFLIVSSFFAKIIRNNTLKKTNSFFFKRLRLKTRETPTVHNNWHNTSILRDISYLECFFKGANKMYIYWSQRNQKIELPYIFQFYIESKFSAALHAPKIKTEADKMEGTSFPAEPLKKYSHIIALYFVQQIKINHKAMFLKILRGGVLNPGMSFYQANHYAYKSNMFKKNIINNIHQKLGLEINLFKKNVSTNNIPNETSLFMQKPPQTRILNNINHEKELNILFGSIKISRFYLKQNHSNSLKNILSTFKTKNLKSQSRVWKAFQNSAFYTDRKENGRVHGNTFTHSQGVNHKENTDSLSVLSAHAKPRNKKNKFANEIFDKKLLKPISIFDSFKKHTSLVENIKRLRRKTVSFTSNHQSGSTKAYSFSNSDQKKPVLSLDSQSQQMEEMFSPKDKTNIVPSGLTSTHREDTSKPYVGSNTKQNIRVYKFKNFPPEEIRYCPYCEVELLPNSIRRYRLGYIEFVSPVTHIWYTASSIPLLLNLSKTMIEGIASCHEALSSGFPPIYKWSYNGESPTSWTFQMQPLKLPINSVPKITPINEILNYNRPAGGDQVKKSNSTEIIFGSNSTMLFSKLIPLENYKKVGNKVWTSSFRIIPHKLSLISSLPSDNNLIIYEKRIKNPFIKNAEIHSKEKTTSWPSVISSFEKIPAEEFKAFERLSKGLEKENSPLLYNNSNRFNPPINMASKYLRGSARTLWREETNLNHRVADIFNVLPILNKETYRKKTDQSIKSGINFPYLFWKDISYNFTDLWIFEYPSGEYSLKNNWFVPVSHKALTLLRNDFDKHSPLVEKTNSLSAKPYSKTVQSFPNQKSDFTPYQKKLVPSLWSPTRWININNQLTRRLSLMLTKRQTWPFLFNQYISSFINLLTRKSPKHTQHLFFPLIDKPAWSFYPKKEEAPPENWLLIKKFSPFLKVELASAYQRRFYLHNSVCTEKASFLSPRTHAYSPMRAAPLFFRKNKGATTFLKGEKRRVLLNTDASVFNISNEIMREFSFFNPIPKKVDSHYDLDTATDYEKKREWLKLEGFFEDPSNQKSSAIPHEPNKTEEKNENDSKSFDHFSLPLVLPFLGKNPDNIEFKSNYFNHENFHTDPLKFIMDLFTTQYIWDYTNLDGSRRANERQGTSLNNNQDPHKLLDQDSNLELLVDQQQYNDTWNNVSIGSNDLITSLSNIYNMPGFFYTNKTVQKKPPYDGLMKKCFSLKKFKWDLSLFLLRPCEENHYETDQFHLWREGTSFWPSLNRFYINNDNWFSKTYPFLPVKSSNFIFQDVLKPGYREALVLNEFSNMEIEKSLNSKNNSLFLQEGYSNQISTQLGSNDFNLNGYHENYQNCFRKLGRNAYYFKLELMTRSENAFLKNLFFRNKFPKTNFFKTSLLVFPFISTSIFHSRNDTNKIRLKTNQLKLNQNFTIGKKTCFLFGFYLNVYDFNFFTPSLARIKYPLFLLKKRNSFFSSIIKQHVINFPTELTQKGESIKILARMEPYKFSLSKENTKNSLWPLKSNRVSFQTSPIQLYYNSPGEQVSLGELNKFVNPFSQIKKDFLNIEEFYGGNGNSFYKIKKGDGSAGKQEKRIRSKNNYQKLDLNNFDRALYENIYTLQFYSKNTFQNSFLSPSFNLLNDGQITKGLKNEQKPCQKIVNSKIKLEWPYKKYFKNLQKNWSPFLDELKISQDIINFQTKYLLSRHPMNGMALKNKRFNQDVFFINQEWPEEHIDTKIPMLSGFFLRSPNFPLKTKKQKSILVPSRYPVGVPVSIIYDFTLSRSSRLIKNTPSLETKQIKNKNQWLKTFKILCIKKRIKKWTKNQNFLNRSLTKNPPRGGLKSSWLKTIYREGNNHEAIPSRFLFYTYKSTPEIKTRLFFKQVPLFFSKNKGAVAFVKQEKRQVLLNTNSLAFVSKKHEYSFKVESAFKQIVDQIPHQKFLLSKETKAVKQKLEPLALLAFDTTKIEFFGSLKIYAKRKFLEIWHDHDQNFRNNIPLLFNRLREFKLQRLPWKTEKVPNKKYVYAKLANGIFPIIKINKEFLDTSRENNQDFLKNQQFLVYPKRNAYLSVNTKDKSIISFHQGMPYQRVYAHDHKAFFSTKTRLCSKQIVFNRFLNSFKQWPYNLELFLTKQQKQLKRPRQDTSLNHHVANFIGTLEQKLFPVRKQIVWFSFYQSRQKFIVLPWKKQFLSKNTIVTRKKKKISHIIVKSLSLNNSYSFNFFRLTKLIIEPEIVENLKHLTMKHHKNMICYAYATETIQKKKRILLNSTIPSKSINNVESELSSAYPNRLSQAMKWNSKYLNHIQSLSFKISCFSYFGYGCIASLNLGNKLVIQKKSLQERYEQKVIVQKIPKQIPFLRCFQQTSFIWKNTNVDKLLRKTPVLSPRAKSHIKNFEKINYIQSNYNLNPRVINPHTFLASSYIQMLKWGERGHIFDELYSSFYKTNNSINHKLSNQFKNSKHNPTKNRVNLHPYKKIRFKNGDPFLFRTDRKEEISNISPPLNSAASYVPGYREGPRFEKLKQKDQTWKGNTNYYGCISQITSWGSDHGSWILFLKYIRANIYKGDQLLSSYFNKMTFQMMPRTGSIMLQQLLSQLVLIPKPLDQTNFISKDESVSQIDTWQNIETNWSPPAGRNKDNYTTTQKSISKIDQNLMMIRNQSNQYFHYNSSFFSKCFIPGKFPMQEKWRCAHVYNMEHIDNPESENSGITNIKSTFQVTLPLGLYPQKRNNKWSSIYYQRFSIIDGLIFFQKNLQKTIQKELYYTLIKKPVRLSDFHKQFKYKLRKPQKFFRNLKNIIDLKHHTNDVSLINNRLSKHKDLKTNVRKHIFNDIIGFETCSQLLDKYVLSAYKIKKPIAHKRFEQISPSYSFKPINNWYRLNNFFSYSQNTINHIESHAWKPAPNKASFNMNRLSRLNELVYINKPVESKNQTFRTPFHVQNIFDTNTNIVILLNQIRRNQNSKRDYSLSDQSMLYSIPSVDNDIRILKLIYSLLVSFQLQFLSVNPQIKPYNNWSSPSDQFQNNKELFNAFPDSIVSNTSSKTINDYTTYKISNTYYHIYSRSFGSASAFLNGQKCYRVPLFNKSKNRYASLVPQFSGRAFKKYLAENLGKITKNSHQNSLRGGSKDIWWYSKSPFLNLLTKKHFIISNTISLNKYHHSFLQNLVWLRSYLLKSKNISQLFSSKPWLLKKNNLSYMLSDKEKEQNTTNGVFKSSSHQNDVENYYFSNQKIKIYNILISPLEISKSWSSPFHPLVNFNFPTISDDRVKLESSPNGLKSSPKSQKSFKSSLVNTKTPHVVSKDLTRWNNEWWKWSYVRPINHFISNIKPYSSTILTHAEPYYFSFNESMNLTKNFYASMYSHRKQETNNLQKNKFPQEQNNKYQNSLASQFNYILPMNLETYKGQVESETLFLKLKEIGNYNLLLKKKNTLFKTLILKMNSSLSPLSSETLGTNQNQLQLTNTIKNCISTFEATQKTQKAPLENWNYHSIFEKKNLYDFRRIDTIKTNILPLSFNGSKFMSIRAVEFFKTWLFLNFVHSSHLDWFNNLQNQYQIYPTRVTQKSSLHGTFNIGEFNDNNCFSKFLHVYEYRKNFLLKKIFKQRVYLTQYRIKQSSMIHKNFLTKLKLVQKIYQKQSATRWVMPNIMKLFGFFNDFWRCQDDRLLKRKINIYYDQERNLNKKYEFKPFGPQIKHDSTYSNWKNLKSFKPQFFHLRNTTIESFKNQTRFRLLTVPQIFDLQDQNNVLNRMRKNKIPINIFGPLVFSSSSKPFKKIITLPALNAPEKQFFWGTRTIFDYKKYSLNSLGLENLYDPSVSAGSFNFTKSQMYENFTPETFNVIQRVGWRDNTNYIALLDQHSPINSETYLNPDRPLSSETLFREENPLLRKVSSSYKALLQKAKILEDYPVPDPNPIDSKSIYLRLLNGNLPSLIEWNLQNTRLGNKLPLFRTSGGFMSHNKPKIRTYFDTNKNTERPRRETDDNFRNGWKKPKNSTRQSYGSLSPFIWDGNQNRFKNSAALYLPMGSENRLSGPSQIRKTTSKDVFSIRDQTKLSALQRVEGSPENKTMTNINDGTSLFLNEKLQTDQREGTSKKNSEAPHIPISEPKTKFFKNQEISLTDQNIAFRKKKRLRRKTFIDLVGNPPHTGITKRNSTFNYGRNLRKLRLQYLRNFRRLRFIEYLKATYIKPEWMILSLLPVLPPDLRPVIANPRGYITGDINTHYQNVIYRNNNIEKLLDTFWIPRKFYSKIAFSNHQKATISMLSSIKSYFYSPIRTNYLPIYRKRPRKLENCYTISELFSKLIRFPFTFLYENGIQKTETLRKNNEWSISFPEIDSSIEQNKLVPSRGSVIFRPKTKFKGGVKVLQTHVLKSTSNLFSKTQLTNDYFEILSKKSKIQNNNREMLFLQAPIFFGNSISTRVYENKNTAAFLFLIKKSNATRRGEPNSFPAEPFQKVVAAPFFDNKMKTFVQKPIRGKSPVLNEFKNLKTDDSLINSYTLKMDKAPPENYLLNHHREKKPFISIDSRSASEFLNRQKFGRVPVFDESKNRDASLTRDPNSLKMNKQINRSVSASLYQKEPYRDKQKTRPFLLHVSDTGFKPIDWKFERLISPMFSKCTTSYFDFNLNTLPIAGLYSNNKTSQYNKILVVNNESWQKSFQAEPTRRGENEPQLRNNSFVPKKNFPAGTEFDTKNNWFDHSDQWTITQDFQKYKKPARFDLEESRFYNLNYKPVLKLYYQRSFFGSNIGIATGYNQIVQTLKLQSLQNNGTLTRNLGISIKDNPVARLEKNIIRTQALHDSKPLQEMQYSLQKAVDALIDNSQKLQSNVLLRKGRPLKSLSDNLKGKEGRFRQHLLGKRVDYSGRSVIVVGPDLKLYECGIPLIMALRLFQPFLILYLIYRFKIASLLATQLIQRKHPMVINLLKKFIETWPILLNRAPTLHRMNIQAFKIRLVQGKAILLHPLVCSSYNADFDGDQMGVHVPITQQARAESWKLLWSINNSIGIASRQPLFLPSQDMVIGNYYLTAPPIDNSLVSLMPIKQEFLNLNLKDKASSFKLSDLNQEFSDTNRLEGGDQSLSHKLIKYPSFGRQWPISFQKMNHYFFSLEEAYQYYLNTVYRFHINTPVWFRFRTMFETAEREKPIEIAIDKYGNSIYTTKYYEKKLKRNRILGKNAFYFSNYLDSQINQSVSKPKSIKSLMFENSIQKVVANFNFSTSVFSKDLEKKTFMFNSPSLYSKANKIYRVANFLSKDFPSKNHSLFNDNQKKFDGVYQNTFTSAYENIKTNKAIISSSQIIFNKNLRPIVLNQIIRSTFGRIEFYYEAFHISRS